MALGCSSLLELVIHRDLLLHLDVRANLERVIPEEINTVLSELAVHLPLILLPLPVACCSYVEQSSLVFCVFIGCGPERFASIGGLQQVAEVLTVNFKLFFAAILGNAALFPLLAGCSVRLGEDCLIE